MAASSKMVLSWNGFKLNATSTFKNLWNDQDFADVTLASVDDQQIRVHKVILSSCSYFFKNILIKNPHPNPLIYLKNIDIKNLNLLMQFIYFGQCEVGPGELDSFLAAGKDLKVNGLMEEVSVMPDMEDLVVKQRDEKQPNLFNVMKEERYNNEEKVLLETVHQGLENVILEGHDTIKGSTVEIDVNFVTDEQDKEICVRPNSVETEIENSVLEFCPSKSDDIISCDQCDFQTKKKHLRNHIRSKHEGIKYLCSECDFQTSQKGNLTFHKRAKHEGVRFKCDQCGLLSTQKDSLNRHIIAKHSGDERQIYSCDQCDFRAFHNKTIGKHTKSVHGGDWIKCDICDFRSTNENTVKKHKDSKHSRESCIEK